MRAPVPVCVSPLAFSYWDVVIEKKTSTVHPFCHLNEKHSYRSATADDGQPACSNQWMSWIMAHLIMARERERSKVWERVKDDVMWTGLTWQTDMDCIEIRGGTASRGSSVKMMGTNQQRDDVTTIHINHRWTSRSPDIADILPALVPQHGLKFIRSLVGLAQPNCSFYTCLTL